MDFEVSYHFENEQQFWTGKQNSTAGRRQAGALTERIELDEIVSKDCPEFTLIDDALRAYLRVTNESRGEYINSDYDVARCAHKLLCSTLFEDHGEYIRKQIVHCLLEDDDPDVLQVAATVLLSDAKDTEFTFELMNNEGAFTRLVDLIASRESDAEPGLHRLFMELLYEMARIQRVKADDLLHVDDAFVQHLFQIIEELSDDASDPYHYPVIRVLLVLNEQFMVAAHDPSNFGPSAIPLTNKVIKILSSEGNKYKTFGENIILLINREEETSLQLLTLKLLYLLFTTRTTYEYFYTNDLRVLVDILIRNLLDLPEEASALRHTYLRVLYPLLAHTQLRYPPQYKREEICKLLAVLRRGQNSEAEVGSPTSANWKHFEDVDETTARLVQRCQKVPWLCDTVEDEVVYAESPTSDDRTSAPTSPISPSKSGQPPPAVPASRKLTKRNSSKASGLSIAPYLIPQLESARASSLSILEVTAQREKPGVITPSRKDTQPGGTSKKERPAVPQARRSGWLRTKHKDSHESSDTVPEGEEKVDDQSRSTGDGPSVTHSPTIETSSEKVPDVAGGSMPIPTVKISTPHKKPPPAPKTRRWRGRQVKEEDEGGGALRNVHFVPVGRTKPSIDTLPAPTPEKTLMGAEAGSEKVSLSTALDEAQAEAINNIGDTLDKTTLGPADVSPRVILAPPSPAPPRSIPGPMFELERSPFFAEEDDEVDHVETDQEEIAVKYVE